MGSIVLISLLCGVIAALGVLVAFLAFRPSRRSEADLVAERLDLYEGYVQAPINLDVEEARQPFAERVLRPLLARLSAAVVRRMPEARRQQLQSDLNLAGRPLGLSAGDFLAVRYVASALAALAGGLFGLLSGSVTSGLLAAAILGLLGFLLPAALLSSRVRQARGEIRRTLPDAMDLMCICVEAGLTFDGAMARVAERHEGIVGREFATVLREVRLGRPRRDAMTALGDRCGVDELHGFAQAVVQSDSLGTSIGRILRVQSDELRRRRRQRAQEQGAKASLKMLFPMILFIFPSIWIVVLGPAVLTLIAEFSHR